MISSAGSSGMYLIINCPGYDNTLAVVLAAEFFTVGLIQGGFFFQHGITVLPENVAVKYPNKDKNRL
jgi:hypothetical protein